jgi:hypothetical protein
MTPLPIKRAWDAKAEEDRWRKSLETAQKMQDKFGEAPEGASGFILLCLAELDAGLHLLQSECFASRATFLADVRRLIAESTTPSRPVASIEAYRASQKQWLEFILSKYEQDT